MPTHIGVFCLSLVASASLPPSSLRRWWRYLPGTWLRSPLIARLPVPLSPTPAKTVSRSRSAASGPFPPRSASSRVPQSADVNPAAPVSAPPPAALHRRQIGQRLGQEDRRRHHARQEERGSPTDQLELRPHLHHDRRRPRARRHAVAPDVQLHHGVARRARPTVYLEHHRRVSHRRRRHLRRRGRDRRTSTSRSPTGPRPSGA